MYFRMSTTRRDPGGVAGTIRVHADPRIVPHGVVGTLVDRWRRRPAQVLRAHKALLRRSYALQREALQAEEAAHCVTTWVHEDHWQAARHALSGPSDGALNER